MDTLLPSGLLGWPATSYALDGADLALVSSSDSAVVRALMSSPPRHIIDLSGDLGPTVENLDGYAGVCW